MKTSSEIKKAEGREKRAQEDSKILKDKLTALNAKLDPIIELAKTRYPNIEEDKALSKLILDFQKIKKQVEPRTLTPKQRKNLISTLKSEGRRKVIVASFLFDPESKSFGDQLSLVFKDANWKVSHYKSSVNEFEGVVVTCITAKQEALPGYNTLVNALKTAGVKISNAQIREKTIPAALPEGTLLVVVGRK